MPNYFYIDINGQKQGPIDEQKLKKLVEDGVIGPKTPLETESGRKGVAGQIPGLFPAASTPKQSFCTNCGKPVSEQAVACMSCGAKPTGHKNFCRQCGVGLKPEQIVCTKCGTAAKPAFSSAQTAKAATVQAIQKTSQVIGTMMNKTDARQNATSIKSWLFDFAFRNMRIEAFCVWIVRIVYAIGLLVMTVGFLACFVGILLFAFFGIADSRGGSILLLFLLPVLCFVFFLYLCWFRHCCEFTILMCYGMIDTVYLIRATRIYVENKNAELEQRISPHKESELQL